MYDYMMRNMLLINIIFKDTVIILTIKHSPVNRHKLINNQYPCHGETIRHKLSDQSSEPPVQWQRAREAVIHLDQLRIRKQYVARRPGCQVPTLHLCDAGLHPPCLQPVSQPGLLLIRLSVFRCLH